MVTTLNEKFDTTAGNAITWTIDSLGSSTTAGRECTAIDNTSNLFLDIRVLIKIVYPNSAPTTAGNLFVFAAGWDSTLGFAGSPTLTGSDAALTFDADATANPTAFRSAGSFFVVQNKTRIYEIPSLATVFGGSLPPKIGLVILNATGQTLSTGCSARYVGITDTLT